MGSSLVSDPAPLCWPVANARRWPRLPTSSWRCPFDLLPGNRTELTMISDEGKGNRRCPEASIPRRRSLPRCRSSMPDGKSQTWRGKWASAVHDLRLEGEVRRHGREPGAGGETTARRVTPAEEADRGSEPRQRRAAVGHKKKRLELAVLIWSELSSSG